MKFKGKLNQTLFVRGLEYGSNDDGYWTYQCMILQLEDCLDVLPHLFPGFDYIFSIDHSNGHNCINLVGLSLKKINLRDGGSQLEMRSSTITADLLGPYQNDLHPLQLDT